MAQGAALFSGESQRDFCLSEGWRICSCGGQGLLTYTDIYISAFKKNYSSLSLSVLHLEPALSVHVCTCISFTFCVKM